MPETGIGLFPDVGGGWFLPRLPGAAGAWIALTGARLGAADCQMLGIATDIVPTERLADLKAAIVADPAAIETALAECEADSSPAPLSAHREDIDRLFAAPTLEGIFAALAADGSDWALAQLSILRAKSPLSMKTTLRQLQAGGAMADFAEVMAIEMRIAARIVMAHDFTEGVRAVIVDKDNAPIWRPADLAGVTDAMLDAVFAPLPPDQEWSPLPDARGDRLGL
jgi:enoyl-CoA hydratase